MEPFTTIASTILSGAATSGVKAIGTAIGKNVSRKKDVSAKLASYLEHLTNRTAYFVTYRVKRQHIEDAYIEPRIIDAAITRLHLPPNEYENAMKRLLSSFQNVSTDKRNIPTAFERIDAAKTFEVELSYIPAHALSATKDDSVILADAGDGKTSLLSYLCSSRLKSDSPKIPIFLDSRELANSNLVEKIRERLTAIGLTEFGENIPLIGPALTIYVDGLDELSVERYAMTCKEINDLNSSSPEIQFTIACRSGAYRGDFAQMLEVSIAPFDREQTEQFVRKWFDTGDSKRADELIGQLRSGERLQELATKPLLLALMCSAFKRYLNLSRRPTALFQQCIDSLLWEWDAQRVVRREGSFANLDLEKKSWLHSLLAKELHVNGLKYCEREIPNSILQENLTKFGVTGENSLQVLAELVSHHSIFVKWTEETYGFSHLAIQEYLASRWFKNDRRWTKLLTVERLNDPWWEYVIAFCFASLDDATEAVSAVFEFEGVSEIRRTHVAAHCLRYDPVVDDAIRKTVIQKILNWYHNGDAQHHDTALFMLVGIDDEWTSPMIRRSLAGTLTAEQLARVISHRARLRHINPKNAE